MLTPEEAFATNYRYFFVDGTIVVKPVFPSLVKREGGLWSDIKTFRPYHSITKIEIAGDDETNSTESDQGG